ncbi:hypothetical protein O0R33_003689 [Shigella sonnei]|nr:hypothetical protein [Shigella sonnei]EFV6725370.1 hypothetical protein [Shigella sonnei]EFZ8481960.1 hypothetical protein [Shigella sonnei]EHA8689572.1 hypothetical protein [Shigella sonnei]EKF8118042.1 hypothetical protein [Shigella sonnei]
MKKLKCDMSYWQKWRRNGSNRRKKHCVYSDPGPGGYHVVTNVIKIWSVENVAISGLRPEPRQRFTEREKIPRPVKRFLNEKNCRFDLLTVQINEVNRC